MKLMKKISIALVFMMVFTILVPAVSYSTVKVAQASTIRLNAYDARITVGETLTLKVLNLGKSQTVKWSSSDKKKATVSKSGKVKAIKAGKVKITATVGKTKLTCSISIQKKVENEPNLSAYLVEPSKYETSMTLLVVENKGELPITFCIDGYVYNEGYPELSRAVSLFDSEDSKSFSLIESVELDAGESADIYYRTDDLGDDFWIDSDTRLLFNFIYDGIEYTGSTRFDGKFSYYQGFLPE